MTEDGPGPARVWRGQVVGIAPTERLKLRRQMAAAASKKESVSLSLFMEVYDLEVQEELSTKVTLFWAEVQMWRQVRGPAVAVMCESRDLGITWPPWHTLMFEEQVAVDMRVVCPHDVKKKSF